MNRKTIFFKLLILLFLLLSFGGFTQSDEADLTLEEIMNRNLVDMSIEDWVDLENQEVNQLSFYGFLNFNAEKVFNEPSIDEFGNTVYESSPFEMSNPNFHLYGGSKLSDQFTVFFNLGINDNDLTLVNAWGNWRIADMFQVRVGRQYRRFGLFNERLDQVPTYQGIEPPELFDSDHLLLPRTSLASIHGEYKISKHKVFKYFVTTSNAESGAEGSVLPFGWDLRYVSSFLLVGMSGYSSNVGNQGSQSSVAFGDGSPSAGILPWMVEDKYNVFGAFAETRKGNFGLKAAYFVSQHDAIRNATDVLALAQNGLLNDAQARRKLLTEGDVATLTEADVNLDGDYTVKTWYLRFTYDINSTRGRFTPYFFLDYYENPETIASKSFGGDNEAGISDDGNFLKSSLGVVYRPIDRVAIKVDGSTHTFELNGKNETYPEVRIDISYMFK